MSIQAPDIPCQSSSESKVQTADAFLKTHVYLDPNFALNDNGKLTRASTAKNRNAVITLTYAQSFDAKIAGKNGKQIQLSGPESSVMTHQWVILAGFCAQASNC